MRAGEGWEPASAGKPAQVEAGPEGTVTVRAVLLGERLPPLRSEQWQTLARGPTTVRVGGRGFAVLLRYGAVVLFAVCPEEEAEFLKALGETATGAPQILDSEQAEIVIAPGSEEGVGVTGQIQITDLAPERLQTIADVLAKSTVLSYHETRIAAAFDRIEPLAAALHSGRPTRAMTRDLLRHMGDVLLTEQRMVGRVEVSERPEVLWDHPAVERLYVRLAKEYELRERDRALARKLNLISRTVSTILDITQNSRNLRVEWYIVILIVVEILLTLYEMIGLGR